MESRKNSKYFPSPPNGLLAWAFTVTLPFRSNDLNSYEIYTESYTNGVNTAGNIFGFTSGSNPTATFTVVPEPATWALLAGGLATLMVFRRRRIS